MILRLTNYGAGSTIVLLTDGLRHVAEIVYTRKIHKYEASADYDRIVTQLKTYGDDEALEEFNRIKSKQESEK